MSTTTLATLAKAVAAGLPTQPVGSVEQLRAAFEALSASANVICPIAAVDHIMPMHQISLRAVVVDPTVDSYGAGPECYRDPRFCKGDEVALGKNALSKIMAAGGVQIVDKRRLDDRSDPHYCEIEVVLGVRDFDGTPRQVIATKEMDLRSGAPETMKPEKDSQGGKTGRLVPYEDTALADKRRHIQSHAETKAIERGIRLLFSLRQKYSAKDLAKPFIVPKLVPALDPEDPDQKAALIRIVEGSSGALYGRPPQEAYKDRLRGALKSAVDRELPEARVLVDATPERALSPAEQLGDDGLDFDEPPAAAAPVHICGCPCSCQAEITAEIAKLTIDRTGSPRCGACFPGRLFSYEPHKHLATLQLRQYPAMTPAMAEEQRKRSTTKGA